MSGLLCLTRASCVLGSCGHGGTGHPGFPCVITNVDGYRISGLRRAAIPNWRRPALGENPETQRELPLRKPCSARISSRVTGHRKVPLFWLLLAGVGAGWVLKIPEPELDGWLPTGELNTWSRESEEVRLLVPVTKHL